MQIHLAMWEKCLMSKEEKSYCTLSHLQNPLLKTSSTLNSVFPLHSDESTYSSSPVATCLFCNFKCFKCLSSQLSQHTLDPKIHHKILNSVLPIFENLKGHKSYHGVGVRLSCYRLADINLLTHFKVSTHCTQLGRFGLITICDNLT